MKAYPNRLVLEVRYLIFFQYGMHSIRERLVKILVGYLNEMQYSMIDNECKAIFNASHEQVEESSNRPWRTEPTYVAKYGDDLWLGVYLSHRTQRPSSKSKDKWAR
ncbi:hypothetical protein Bca101_038834 [Brassica carinata]